MKLRNINKVTLFLVLTFALDWGMIEIFYALGGENTSIAGTIVTVIYMFFPMLVAFFIDGVIHKQKIAKSLLIRLKPNWWWLIAWLFMPLLGFAAMGVSLLFPDVTFSYEMEGMFERFAQYMSEEELQQMHQTMEDIPVHPIWLTLVQALFAGISVNAVAGLGEEAGWRGFLLREWGYMKFWKHSLLVGAIWGIWHAPLILRGHNYPDHPVLGVGLMVVWCMLLAPLFTYVTVKGKSVLTAAIFHGTLNASAGLAIMMIIGGSDITVGVTGVSGFIVLAVVNVILLIYDKSIASNAITDKPVHHKLKPLYDGQEGDQGSQNAA